MRSRQNSGDNTHANLQYGSINGGSHGDNVSTELTAPHDMKMPCIPHRYVMSFLAFWGLFLLQATRFTFSIALVAMVNFTAEQPAMNDSSMGCPNVVQNYTPAVQKQGDFNWDGDVQALLLACFFYGYVITQFPGGNLADRIGGARVFGLTVLLPGIVTMFYPVLARWDFKVLVAARILAGLLQGPSYPAHIAIWGKWAPELERTKLTAFALSGATAGVAVSMATTGYLCDLSLLGGWPFPFYLFGGASCLWWIIWVFFAADNPRLCRWVSPDELAYIEKETNDLDLRKYVSPPWLSVISSGPMWALWVYVLCDGLGYYVVVSCVPIYMKQVLGFDISEDGLLSALPMIVSFLVSVGVGAPADWAVRRWRNHRTTIRKLLTFLGQGSIATACMVIGFTDCNRVAIVSLLVVGYGLNGLNNGGVNVITLDMAPQYAGSLVGLTNFVDNIGGFMSPTIVQAITGGEPSHRKWQIVFFLTSAIMGFGMLVFLLLGSAKVQPWAEVEPLPKTEAPNRAQDPDSTQIVSGLRSREGNSSETQPLMA